MVVEGGGQATDEVAAHSARGRGKEAASGGLVGLLWESTVQCVWRILDSIVSLA